MRCPVFDYTEKKIITIDACKKEILNEFARIRKLTSSSSPWVKIFKLTRDMCGSSSDLVLSPPPRSPPFLLRNVPSCYDKNQLPSLAPTQLVFFYEVHVKQVCGPPTTSQVNECNVLFPRNEEGKVDVKRGVYETNNLPKKEKFKYE